jgi:TetR/AcrR family transcriptional regulator
MAVAEPTQPSTPTAGRPTGRPRLQPRPLGGDATDEILAVASRLFQERGVTSTTMSLIAGEAGLRQSSLYYYFRRKEEVVAAIVARANVVPLTWVRQVETDGGPAAVRLFRFVRGDVIALCHLPFDINEVHRYAARDQAGFERYWSERRTLERRIASIVRDGVARKEFRQVNTRLTALTIMSNDEAVQNWFRLDHKPVRDPRTIGTFVAELTVGGLLRDGVDAAEVRRQADELDVDRPT